MKILNAQQIREIDRLTVERFGIPWPILMETAGGRVVEALIERIGTVAGRYIAVLCGKGNNGGDGAVIARLLWMRGASVDAFLFGRIVETKGEALTNFEILQRLAEEKGNAEHPSSDLFFYENASVEQIDAGYDVVIDAIFGTGLNRPAQGILAEAIETIRLIRGHETSLIVSVDIPSGLSSDRAAPIGVHVDADLTISFTAPKIGNILAPACRANGELIIAAIGTPEWIIDEESGSWLNLVEREMIASWLGDTERPIDAHKGTVGDVLLFSGSRGKTGAAALASAATLRAGAGLVTVATAGSAQAMMVGQVLPEVMTEPLEETARGAISSRAIERALELSNKRTVLAIGPGLSSADQDTRTFVREMLAQRRAPVVLDADGLNAVAPWPDDLQGSDDLPIIVTPHPGEMARLSGLANSDVTSDRIAIAREFARRSGAITVLKGSRTIIASPDGEVFVNATGNPGMATAGSGDVLTGLLAGLLAQRPGDPLGATIAAVYLHGLAGDLATRKKGMRSLLASDIIDHLSEAFLITGGENERGEINSIKRI